MKLTADKDTAFAIPVSKDERDSAYRLRRLFEKVLEELDKFEKFSLVFFDYANKMDAGTSVKALSPLIKKYEHKLKKKFNGFIMTLESALEEYNSSFTDTELTNMRDLLIENAKTMRNSLIELLQTFKKIDDQNFIADAKTKYEFISKAIEQLKNVIRGELFNHIDYNILGRIRLGINQAPLVIRGKHGN